MDPLVAILGGNWGTIGGWGLFIGLTVIIVVGSFKEWWVPGNRYRSTERLLSKSVQLNSDLSDQNRQLLVSNQLTAEFFRKTAPQIGAGVRDTRDDFGGEIL